MHHAQKCRQLVADKQEVRLFLKLGRGPRLRGGTSALETEVMGSIEDSPIHVLFGTAVEGIQ